MGQLWVTSTQGQLLYSPLLSKEVAFQMQTKAKFLQFCEAKSEWGKNAGEIFKWDKYGNIDTEGGRLTETATIPKHGYSVTQGTATMYEWGNAIPFTKKYETLAQAGTRQDPVRILSDDHAKVYDTAVEAEFDRAKIRYVGTSTAGGGFTTNGTATLTCTSQFNTYHLKTMVDYLFQTLHCEPYDGEDYMAICSTDAKRGVYDQVVDIIKYTQYPATGEFGKYYDCRLIKTNHGLSNAIGASSAYGEAYMFGAGGGPVARGIALPMRVIPDTVMDFGRSQALAWYSIEAFAKWQDGNPDSNVIKFDSA
jgi:hypothetical protein